MQEIVKQVKAEIERCHGEMEKVGDGRSLFYLPSIKVHIYFRYSKIMRTSKPYAFFGLRKHDMDLTRNDALFICLVTDNPELMFSIPFADFKDCFGYAGVNNDNQYKTILFFKTASAQLYIPRSARFNAEAYRGVGSILAIKKKDLAIAKMPKIDHSTAQSLVGSIGAIKGHQVWFPKDNLDKIDYDIMDKSRLCDKLPSYGTKVDAIFQEIDVIWLNDNKPIALFEVEHSTAIYSGLLRINDVLISSANPIDAEIVADQKRRDNFQRQIRRPTFEAHKLEEKVSFISYANVWQRFHNLTENQ